MNSTEKLDQLGWRQHFADQLKDLPEDAAGLIPARVVRQDLNRYHLLSAEGPLVGILPGRTRIETHSKGDLPCVGDWVLCSSADQEDPTSVVIEHTLTRFSKFSRKEAGDRFEEQVVAANVDTVFIVTGLDDNFNVRRIERYLMLAWNSGANPVIVLSKADLSENLDECMEMLAPVAMGTPVHVVSALKGEGIEVLRDYVGEGQTVALLGSSGVGKSTIINALLGYERFETGEVREGDSKGRHTTTFRELCQLPGGGLLIDTPGMREIQIWADDASLATSFKDVESLASKCRFNDCSHNAEPGCAVREAIELGELEATRLESYWKFKRELAHFAEKQDASLRAERKAGNRKRAKAFRKRPTKRD